MICNRVYRLKRGWLETYVCDEWVVV